MAQPPIVVTQVRQGILGTKIRVHADRSARVRRGSYLGVRVFGLRAGQSLTLRVRTSHWKVGERLSMNELVNSARDWADIPWDWEP